MENHGSRSSLRAQIPYGIDLSDKLVHVNDVVSGLECGLRCPACLTNLVARKGKIKIAHLAHYTTSVSCREEQQKETILHLLAKKILSSGSQMDFPKGIASWLNKEENIFPKRLISYKNVRIEEQLDGIRPDIIISVEDVDILIEVYVTHACDDKKIAKLKERGLIAIEIDLSKVSLFDDPSKHIEQVLESAPRKWLYHPDIEKVEREFERLASIEENKKRKNLELAWNITSKSIAKCWNHGERDESSYWSNIAERFDLEIYLDIDIPADNCFSVGSNTWKTAILSLFLLELNGNSINLDSAVKHLQTLGMMKEPFEKRRKWEPELLVLIRKQTSDFEIPGKVIEQYVEQATEFRLLSKVGHDLWKASLNALNMIEDKKREKIKIERLQELRKFRRQEVNGFLLSIAQAIGKEGIQKLGLWWHSYCYELESVPLHLTDSDNLTWQQFIRKLNNINNMLVPGGAILEDRELLGLPLQEQRNLRIIEKEGREAQERENRKTYRRNNATKFILEIKQIAEKELGEEGVSFIDSEIGLPDDLGEDKRFDDINGLYKRLKSTIAVKASEQKIKQLKAAEEQFEIEKQQKINEQKAIQEQLEMERQQREKQINDEKKNKTVNAMQKRLTELAYKKYSDKDKAESWLTSFQFCFGMSPLQYCIDVFALGNCQTLLKREK